MELAFKVGLPFFFFFNSSTKYIIIEHLEYTATPQELAETAREAERNAGKWLFKAAGRRSEECRRREQAGPGLEG